MATAGKRPFAGMKMTKGNPQMAGTCHAKVFEMLLRKSGCTTKDIQKEFEAKGIIWESGYGVILSHFKQSRYRSPRLGNEHHPVYARKTGDTRQGRDVHRLYHSKEDKWLNEVPQEKWNFPVSAAPVKKAKPKAKPKAKAKVKPPVKVRPEVKVEDQIQPTA